MGEAIDSQDWDALESLLGPQFSAHYVHTGETFDREGFVRVNREYPGHWAFDWEEVVDGGTAAVGRAKVSDGMQVFYVATFARTDANGRLDDVVEVWTEVGSPPADRT
jgi:hypothetical protein